MSTRKAVPPSPAPLEAFAQEFDALFTRASQRNCFRHYLIGLLLPSERNKTLTALANSEPLTGAQNAAVQRLQWFLSEARWKAQAVNQRCLELLRNTPATAPHSGGVLVIDETGDRKAGTRTAHVGRQYLANLGKVENGVVAVSSLWADEQIYYPLAVEPYTPKHWFAQGKHDPAFRTKPQMALQLVQSAHAAALPFRAVVADAFYGKNEHFVAGLHELPVGYVVALPPSYSWWHPHDELGTVEEVARAARWQSAKQPGAWVAVERAFRDGRTETWWALEGHALPFGPTKSSRLVVVTTDPLTLPELSTWYLRTNLPCPGTPPAQVSPLAPAPLAEVVRLYGLRMWVEQSYKHVKQALGWADYQVRTDHAIRRHWQLVMCAFAFCWWAHAQTLGDPWPVPLDADQQPAATVAEPRPTATVAEEKKASPTAAAALVADHPARRTRLA